MEGAPLPPLWLVVWHSAVRARQPPAPRVQVRLAGLAGVGSGGQPWCSTRFAVGRHCWPAALPSSKHDPQPACLPWPALPYITMTLWRWCRQYPHTSVWHRVKAPLKPGREAVVNNDCSFGYVGGLRRLTAGEREEWRRHGAPHPPAPALLQALEAAAAAAAAAAAEDDWSDDDEEGEQGALLSAHC